MGQASGEQWGRTTGGSPCHPGPAAPLDWGSGGCTWGVERQCARSLVCHSLRPTCGVLFMVPAASRSGGGEPGGLWTCLGQDAAVLFPDAQLYQLVGRLFVMLRKFSKFTKQP